MKKFYWLAAVICLLPTPVFAQTAGACAEVTGQGFYCNTLMQLKGGIELPNPTTVAQLPTCNANSQGQIRVVSDATSPAYNATIAGSGAVITMVLCNGTNWTAH